MNPETAAPDVLPEHEQTLKGLQILVVEEPPRCGFLPFEDELG